MKKTIFLIIIFGWLSCALLLGQEKGMASYYSNRLHGRRMSDGTKYHKDSLTCAHKRYPLGSYVKFTHAKSGKSVVVKVTDRCRGSRVIDLSYAAAKQLGLIASGVAMVLVERYHPPKGIPYKDDDEIEIPELDLEITDGDSLYRPVWNKK